MNALPSPFGPAPLGRARTQLGAVLLPVMWGSVEAVAVHALAVSGKAARLSAGAADVAALALALTAPCGMGARSLADLLDLRPSKPPGSGTTAQKQEAC